MKHELLGNLTKITTGKLDVNAGTPDGKYPFFTCAELPYKINEYAFDTEAILIAGNGDLNVKYYQGKFNAYQRTYVIQISKKEELFCKYLFYFMRGYINNLRRMSIGGIIKYIKLNYLTDAKIPLPPLSDQIRIATLLSKAEALIVQRKESLRLLDELLKSTFLEMFGDPVRNEKGWAKTNLCNFGAVITGNTPPRANKENYSNKFIEWIKTDNINDDKIFVTSALEYLSESGAIKARILKEGALLVTCIAGSLKSIGNAALTNRSISFNQQINAIQPNNNISPLFIYWLFKICRKYIQNVASKGMKKIITKSTFEGIRMIKPPFELQEQFSKVAEKAEALKANYQASLKELENLYSSLSQRAFKGELDLSKMDIEQHSAAMVESAII
ncbi:MAG: restriction endonuclease subunit S [Nitrospirae bacterium]|nr:restriction endonuclease subunit S [Nitrospirota bacterium]